MSGRRGQVLRWREIVEVQPKYYNPKQIVLIFKTQNPCRVSAISRSGKATDGTCIQENTIDHDVKTVV